MLKLITLLSLCVAVFASPTGDAETFIIGGEMASPGLSPWTVSIRNSFDFHNCGGGIVSARWVLTTAHCLASRLASNTMIVAGSNRLDSGGQSYRGSRIVIHPSYNSNTLAHDMGLVETSTPIIFSNLVQRLTIGRNEIGGGVWASFAGWGWTSHPVGSTSNELQWIQFRTMTNEDCRNEFTLANAVRITDQTLCTSGENGGICIGDSGGVLEHNGFAIGVQSWGIACATGRPDVFMRVSQYANWILNEIGEL